MWRNRYADSIARVILYTYGYVLLEWLFLVTKPSFLGSWSVLAKIQALFAGAAPFLFATLVACGITCVLAYGLDRTGSKGSRYLLKLVPAMIAAAIVLMLVDNFTYTMFGWGIVKTTAWTVPIYWLLLLGVVIVHLRRVPLQTRLKAVSALVLVVLTCVCVAWSFAGSGKYSERHYASALTSPLPNIIMFASDGMNADHMSAYGYARQTTPNLEDWMSRAMVVDNAFTNAGWTASSLTSMMTSKYPATTKMLYPPNTLRGKDAYQTLPRVLRKLGYTNMQEALRYYADGPDLNWKGSFDVANGRKVQWQFDSLPLGLDGPLLFADRLYERLSKRVKQLALMQHMVDQHAAVTSAQYAQMYGITDDTRMAAVHDFIRGAKRPFFIHVHLMGTHCCDFAPKHKKFSLQAFADKDERKTAAFDDTILQADKYFGALMQQLKQQHLLDNTLVVVSSDHNMGWDYRSQVPLIFIFPHGAHRGHVTATAQLLDVAPTILDYLKVSIPDWMEGKSLLRDGLPRGRPIYSIYRVQRKTFDVGGGHELAKIAVAGPPTYGLSSVGMVVCQRWFYLQARSGKTYYGAIPTYREKCPAKLLPTPEKARAMMYQHLEQRGISFEHEQ